MNTDPFGYCAEPECTDDTPKELPSFTDMLKGISNTAKDVAKGVILGEGVLVTEETYSSRISICNGCEFFIKEDKRCSQCGCFMEAKARLKKAFCPIHKWEMIDD